ncbi:hypothetical protein [Streptomyces sp. NPDC013489]|uniref:hypothetical protein n=1 Tax=Streptomyces sp. NPDC013489 TaxID=3155606 RepID=UPI0033C745C1
MFPDQHRLKGGAPQLGARHPGERGPFGIRPDNGDGDGQEHGTEQPPPVAAAA